jgi:hypothetical protein
MNNSNFLHGYTYFCILYISVEDVKSYMKTVVVITEILGFKSSGQWQLFGKKSEFAVHISEDTHCK